MTNVVLNPMVGGNIVGTDTVGGVDYEIVKLGVSAAGVAPVQVSATNPLPITIISGAMAGAADASGFTAGTTPGLPVFGLFLDSATLTSGQAGAPRLSSLRQLLVAQQAVVNGGCNSYGVIPAASNNAAVIKGTPGSLYSVELFNVTGTLFFVKLYNKATAPAPATDNALLIKRFPVPASTTGAGVVISWSTPVAFAAGIGIAIVGGIADTDNTPVAAACGTINVGFF